MSVMNGDLERAVQLLINRAELGQDIKPNQTQVSYELKQDIKPNQTQES